jgi:hypothetical protein
LRKLIIAASLCALAVPAAAQPPRHTVPANDDIARRLPPPGEIEAMGAAIARVADALMAVDVGPVGDALDPYRRPGRRETLGDIAHRDDPYARQRMHRSIGSTSAGMAAAMRELTIITPVLRRSIEDAARRIDDAARTGAYPRYGQRDYYRGYDRDHDPDHDRDHDRDYDPDHDRDLDRDRDRDRDED